MNELISLCFSALLMGFASSPHCVGMCGGIVSACTYRFSSHLPSFKAHSCYNLGRIISYSFLGALLGFTGSTLEKLLGYNSSLFFRILASLLILCAGLYILGYWRGLAYLESLGQHLWKPLQSWSSRLFPLDSYLKIFCLGLCWGLLPCGLVYTALSVSLSINHPGASTLFMLCFGLGTLPTLMILSTTTHRIHHYLRSTQLRYASGLLLILFSIISLLGLHYHLPFLGICH